MSVPTSRPPELPAGKRRPPVSKPSRDAEPANGEPVPDSPQPPPSIPIFERSFWVRFWEQLNGEAGAGYLLSLGFHLVLLALLAIPVIRELQREEQITTVIFGGDSAENQGVLGDPINTGLDLALPEPSPGNDVNAPKLTDLGPSALAAMDVDPNQIQGLKSLAGGGIGAPGAGGGKQGTGGSGDGVRVADPPNAIQAGNFSVWSWPIQNKKKINGDVEHGEPGSYPKVFQSYHIVIRVRVPGDEKRIPVGHFSGQVVGTDKYFQKIPQNAFYYNAAGKLVEARTGQSIPVFNGVAELLIEVPPASKPDIKDTITIRCRTIDEEQTVELVFKALQADPEPAAETP